LSCQRPTEPYQKRTKYRHISSWGEQASIRALRVANDNNFCILDAALRIFMEPVPQSINALPLEIRMERLSQCTNIFDLFHPPLENAAAFLPFWRGSVSR
jgi:hypothetical protein